MTPLLSTDVTHNSLIGDIASWFLQQTSAGLSLFNVALQVEILCEGANIYRKVAISNTSHLEAHAGFSGLLMKGIFYPYIL